VINYVQGITHDFPLSTVWIVTRLQFM